MTDFLVCVDWNRPQVVAGGAESGARTSATGQPYFSDGSCTIRLIESASRPSPEIVHASNYTAVGTARLDNRDDVLRRQSDGVVNGSDLAVAAECVATSDPHTTSILLGDFAIVTWHGASRTLIGARDAFGVRRLYYTVRNESILFASRGSLLANDTAVDLDYIAEFLATGGGLVDRTVYANIFSVPPGGLLVASKERVAVQRYWVPHVRRTGARDYRGAAAEFRELFLTGVRQRVQAGGVTWARLSGGLDSSSIVCAASHDAERNGTLSPIAGTVTTVDSLGRGDERPFASAVLERYGLQNVQVADYWLWRNDGAPPPLTDEPHVMYPFYARDRRGAAAVRERGGQVLLCGMGADHYMHLVPVFATDALATGHLGEAIGCLWDWAVSSRQSFWRYLERYAMRPFVPQFRKARARRFRRQLPWLNEGFVQAYGILERDPSARHMKVAPGHHLEAHIAYQLAALPTSGLAREISGAGLDVRYPFLYRPLVEFALSLPPQALTRPNEPKWILREALRDVLPEIVRTRSGKGTIGARVLWSLEHERKVVSYLTHNTMLAAMGCIDEKRLRSGLRRAQRERRVTLWLHTLSLEMWLRVRFGEWSPPAPNHLREVA